MGICLTSARYGMKADVLRQWNAVTAPTVNGEWTSKQDPITGEITRIWTPVDTDTTTAGTQTFSIECDARALTSMRAAMEAFGQVFENLDAVIVKYSSSVIISRRDRLTNIRTAKTGDVVWIEEELGPVSGEFKATVFNVSSIVPIMDPFGRHVENMALLERADVQ